MLLLSVVFLIWTVFFIVCFSGVIKILHFLIQPGQFLGFWQERLRQWDIQGTPWGNFRYKILGGCTTCFSHFLALIGFVMYASFMNGVLGLWVPGWGNLVMDVLGNITFFFAFVHTLTLGGLFFITKLFK